MGLNICSLGFFQMNVNEPMLFKIEQVFHYILCHLIVLGAHVLGSKSWGRKGFFVIKLKNGILAIKKHCEGEYFDIKFFFCELTL
jgi:hypothetical protein